LRIKLEAEGLFDSARKKPIPSCPGKIGIVTSPQAARCCAILNILQRRHHSASVLIFPAQCAGGERIARRFGLEIRYFNQAGQRGCDHVARGGGSAEDLAALQRRRTGAGGRLIRRSL